MNTGPDHAMIDLYITFTKFERGRGFWKFNNSLLNDCVYVDKIKDTMLFSHIIQVMYIIYPWTIYFCL